MADTIICTTIGMFNFYTAQLYYYCINKFMFIILNYYKSTAIVMNIQNDIIRKSRTQGLITKGLVCNPTLRLHVIPYALAIYTISKIM